ncbi:MAG: Maf family protein [Dehalococcoidia bacterium]|nr:Maf family protein [Dehalococcoidia bacterium]
MDKAGAYAIQDEDVPTVTALQGCYCAVMGLPLWITRGLLEEAGVPCRVPSAAFPRCAACPSRPDGG